MFYTSVLIVGSSLLQINLHKGLNVFSEVEMTRLWISLVCIGLGAYPANNILNSYVIIDILPIVMMQSLHIDEFNWNHAVNLQKLKLLRLFVSLIVPIYEQLGMVFVL